MQVLRKENPLVVSGLTLPQRLSYAATLLGWFDAWRSLGYLLLPIAVVATGAVPIRAEPLTFAVAFLSTFALQQLALRVLSRGCHRPILSILFEFVRMTPNLLATLTLLTPRRRATFKVTPKGRQGDGRNAVHVPLPLRGVAVLSFLGAAWFAATVMGATPVVYEVPWAVYAAFGWLILNVALVMLAIRRIRALRYAPERRASVRFDTDLTGTLDGTPCRILDLSLTGGRLLLPGPLEGFLVRELRMSMGDEPISLVGIVRLARPDHDGSIVAGLEFAEGQFRARARLALALFSTRVAPRSDPRAAEGEALAAA
jgi:cellulose synthase (UDP-forming)